MVGPLAVQTEMPGQRWHCTPQQPGPFLDPEKALRMPQPIDCQDTYPLACLDVRSFPDTAGSCVRLRGELDLASASHLEKRLDRLRRGRFRFMPTRCRESALVEPCICQVRGLVRRARVEGDKLAERESFG